MPRVRKYAAERLYEALLTDAEPPPDAERALELLNDTDWAAAPATVTLEQLRGVRNQICDILRVPRPVPVLKK